MINSVICGNTLSSGFIYLSSYYAIHNDLIEFLTFSQAFIFENRFVNVIINNVKGINSKLNLSNINFFGNLLKGNSFFKLENYIKSISIDNSSFDNNNLMLYNDNIVGSKSSQKLCFLINDKMNKAYDELNINNTIFNINSFSF